MAKESNSTRIPRLDGVSRIPLPGSIRPPSLNTATTRSTQILRPTAANFAQQRPTSLGVLKPHIPSSINTLKRSSSGERISNAVNIVSKKTTAAFKKFIGKPERTLSQFKAPIRQVTGKNVNTPSPTPSMILKENQMTASTPRPLTRSDTFVRDDKKSDLLSGLTPQNILAQSTPAPNRSSVCETTQLLSSETRHALYTTHDLDKNNIHVLPALGDTITLDKSLRRTSSISKTLTNSILSPVTGGKFNSNTMCLNTSKSQEASDRTQTFQVPNLMKTFNATQILGKTMFVNSPTEHLQNQLGSTMTFNNTSAIKNNSSKCIELIDLVSPTTNATYSNPGSLENIQMLEDVAIPVDFDMDGTLQPQTDMDETIQNADNITYDNEEYIVLAQAPDKTTLKLPLSSTLDTERLLEITPARHVQLLNLTKDFMETTPRHKNNTQLLYMTQVSASATSTPDCNSKFGGGSGNGSTTGCNTGSAAYQYTPVPMHLLSPLLLKGAQSDLVLPTRTPDDELLLCDDAMDIDATLSAFGARTEEFLAQQRKQAACTAVSLQDVNNPNANQKQKSRFSFGLDLTESTLDCSIELVDVSLSSTVLSQPNANLTLTGSHMTQSNSIQQLQQQLLKKQNSFDMDESLGILTPDQMKEFLDSTTTNTNNLELPLHVSNNNNNNNSNKMALHQMRIDQTPSPEELPLDPVEVKTDITDMVLAQQHIAFSTTAQQRQQNMQQPAFQSSSNSAAEPVSLHTDTELSKADQMTKSNVSKISTSFITSVTSVTSLDTGYQGDGEMSRPASRGACDHSPSNGPVTRKGGHVSRQPSFNQQQMPPVRRQDPMTDSDFFTESDADDIFHRGDRRAQVIDGQLYGPMLQQPTASVFISEDPQMEDSCMESSGIFTDVENRCDEDLAQMRRQDTQDVADMSPDGDINEGDDSTETVKSNRDKSTRTAHVSESSAHVGAADVPSLQGQQQQLSCSQTSSTIQSSFSTDRLSAATLSNRTSYCSVDGSSANVDCKSFSSLEEAFNECVSTGATAESNKTKINMTNPKRLKSSTTTGNVSNTCRGGIAGDQQQLLTTMTVHRLSSPRKHASLTSLHNTNGAYGAKNENTDSSVHPNAETLSPSSSGSKVSSLSNSAKSVNTTNCVRSKLISKGSTSGSASPKLRSSLTSSSSTSAPTSNSPSTIVRKSHTPNKWDAVMNKIATNKVLLAKKNYNDVKSKVSTTRLYAGLATGGSGGSGVGTPISNNSSATNSPTVRRSPTTGVLNGAGGTISPTIGKVLHTSKTHHTLPNQPTDTGSPQAKRLIQAAASAKRGRSYSKDSQKSSQSDLSHTSGSPKLLAKTPLRAAKKRDVRNLSISPTDLGPPPKTQQTLNGTSTRPKAGAVTLTQKRFSGSTNVQSVSVTSTAASTPTGSGGSSIKSSPPAKKHNNIITRRFEPKTATATATTASTPTAVSQKQPLKEHNGGLQHNNNNNINVSATNTRTSSQSSSPILGVGVGGGGHHGKKITSTTGAAATAVLLEKKSQTKVQSTRKLLFQKQHPQQRYSEDTPAAATPTAEYLNATELQQLKLLNRHSCNGRLDYESLERHLQQAELLKQQQDKSVEALGVLLQYLVYDLDAFACPQAKNETNKTKESLLKTLHLLDDAKNTCSELQDQLFDKEAYYTRREEELQALHRCELEKAQTSLSEFQVHATEQICALETKLAAKDEEHKRAYDCYRLEMDNKLSQKQQQLTSSAARERELHDRLLTLEITEQDLRNKLSGAESLHATRLQAAAERERELNERIKALSHQLEALHTTKDNNERELRDKLNLSQDEISVLRLSRKNFNESFTERGSGSSPRNSSSSSSATSLEISRLQSEAESLRCVLELKQKEISKLSKHNEELLRDADERVSLQSKFSLLESRNEILQSDIEIKSEKEKDLLRQIDEIQKAFNHETTKRTRLQYDNEALQWSLKQRSEQLHIVEGKLQETLNVSTQNSTLSSNRSTVNNGSNLGNMSMDNISPPASPVIKAVIEKPDSVSWVLEMDDETPEAAASKMVKRAGSFRSVERSPSLRRHLSVSASAAYNSNGATAANGSLGSPNPLSQSMSATSVIRQHSSETASEFTSRSQARIRSKSVSVKSTELSSCNTGSMKSNKKLSRQNSLGNSRKYEHTPGAWKEPNSCSSPYQTMRPRTSTMCVDVDGDDSAVLFRRSPPASSSSRKLITCDTSTLNSGERLEMRSLPTHSSVHDLKVLKKCQEIQESAGEAMVSGTNSEDEGCSASSDEVISTTSTTSATSGSTSSLNQMKNSHMSLEEVLLLDKINSLNGTPMEVSWSDDGAEVFTNGSTV